MTVAFEPHPAPEELYVALWIGALLAATNTEVDIFPAELDALALPFFVRYRPIAQA